MVLVSNPESHVATGPHGSQREGPRGPGWDSGAYVSVVTLLRAGPCGSYGHLQTT